MDGWKQVKAASHERRTDHGTKMVRRSIFWYVFFAITATWGFQPNSALGFSTGKLAPDISGGPWINSRPLSLKELKGRVVLVEFWTYG